MISSFSFLHRFKQDISSIRLPSRFTYPFCYVPHELAQIASIELQDFIIKNLQTSHNFGLDNSDGLGKMFGVLVVKDSQGQLGYLAAFSGKLEGGNHYSGFVPPVFDTLEKDGFYVKGEQDINEINSKIYVLENDSIFVNLKTELENAVIESSQEIEILKKELKESKNKRQTIRQNLFSNQNNEIIVKELEKESIRQHYILKDTKRIWQNKIDQLKQKLALYENQIFKLKQLRKEMSGALQQKLFENYAFLSNDGEVKNLIDIFQVLPDNLPPSGAGECAAPKLMQFAYKNGMKPIALMEFWWGKSPSSEVRKHKQYYPACKSKCKPILGHMLKGLVVDENPMLVHHEKSIEIPVVYQDDDIVVINKPIDFLSVPGKEKLDSVSAYFERFFDGICKPIVVHRLDMSTSGVMIIAKNMFAYHHLQQQFADHKIQKRYVAVLQGEIKNKYGAIELPLRVDLDHRPRQLVCFEYGRYSYTEYEVLKVLNNKTLINFFPKTGRTHQLRVHSAHTMGLNSPIVGDDLYGSRADRLYLHAEEITFSHPSLNKKMKIEIPSGFRI